MNARVMVLLLIAAAAVWWLGRQPRVRRWAGDRLFQVRGQGSISLVNKRSTEVLAAVRPEWEYARANGLRPASYYALLVPREDAVLVHERLRMKDDLERAAADHTRDCGDAGFTVEIADLQVLVADVPEAQVRLTHSPEAMQVVVAGLLPAGSSAPATARPAATAPRVGGEAIPQVPRTREVWPRWTQVTSPLAGAISLRFSAPGILGDQVFARSGSVVTAGRSPASHIVVPEDADWVSAEHVQLRRVGDRIAVRDTSTNGTWLVIGDSLMRLLPDREERVAVGSRIALDEDQQFVIDVLAPVRDGQR